MADGFDEWMRRNFTRDQAEGWFHIHDGLDDPLSADHIRRLIAFLHCLSGHAPGPLPAEELKAIRARAEAVTVGHVVSQWAKDAVLDRTTLLRALDAALADLAAAEGALADLCSPESGEANAAYLRGVEAGEARERARCAALLRLTAGDHRRFLPQATRGAEKRAVTSIIAALEDAADEVESPPAPAAAQEGE